MKTDWGIDDAHNRRRVWIAEEAADLFERVGYHQVRMQDIAAAVGLAKPTLYHYFSTKQDVLEMIHLQFISVVLERQRAREPLNLSASDMLLEIISDVLRLMDTHRGHVRVFFEHHRELTDDARERMVIERDRYQQMIEDVVREGVARQEFRPVDPRLATLAVAGMTNWVYQWYRADGSLTTGEIAEAFFSFIFDGIRA